MGSTRQKVTTADQLDNGDMQQVSVGDTDLLLARVDDEIYATGAYCSHYGAPLDEGVLERDTGCVVCPWHHAVFELDTGDHVEPPGRNCLNTFDVTVEDGDVFVEVPDDAPTHRRPAFSQRSSSDNRHFVIVGGGAAGSAALETLRERGFEGRITLVSNDAFLPYDRPNLSKAYLAGEASPDWLPLRSEDFYDELDIDVRLETRATGLSPDAKVLECGEQTLEYDKLLLATGGQPRHLDVPGADLEGTYLLRTRRDCDAIIDKIEEASSAVLVGSSFIGMETAAALRTRGLDVDVVSLESEPFERVFGPQVGRTFRELHEKHGVQFHLDSGIDRFEGDSSLDAVALEDGTRLDAELAIVGVGVEPATSFMNADETEDDGSLDVDDHLRVAPDVYAAGDIARFPDPRTYRKVRIEHWRLAQQHGATAARNMLGEDVTYDEVPFFWTRQFNQSFKYVGHAREWEDVILRGDLDERDYLALYVEDDDVRAAVGTRGDALTRLHAQMRHASTPTVDEVLGGDDL
jgi:NADPH-dependent 2,4-dienoyl-CoA reductase/sulfur reductase-like enzyme/nitrite reductase/ring-hydroxylating ferredoxin subunit